MSSSSSGCHGSPLRRLASIVSVALILPALALIAGCPDGSPKDVVSGTCKMGDVDVAGKVVFLASDGKTYSGPILGGKYKVENAPKGKYKVYIESAGLVGVGGGAKDSGSIPVPKDTATAKDKAGAPTAAAGGMGEPPPEKYKKADTSGLEYDYPGGKQEWNIPISK